MGRKKPFWEKYYLIMESKILIAIAFLTIGWRFYMIPWDLGGFFLQAMVIIFGLGYFEVNIPKISDKLRNMVRYIVLPLLCFIVFVTVYFSPQCFFPIILIMAAIMFLVNKWQKVAMKRLNYLGFLIFIPLLFYCVYGFKLMANLVEFKNLEIKSVKQILFINLEDSSKAKQEWINYSREDMKKVIDTLKYTTPYSPNHDRIIQPICVIIFLKDNRYLKFLIGKGNSVTKQTIWIEFNQFFSSDTSIVGGVYQNPKLYKVLNNDLKLFQRLKTGE